MTVASPPTPVDLPPAGTRWPWGQLGLLLFLSSLCLNVVTAGGQVLFGPLPEFFEMVGALLCVTGLLTWLVAVFWNQRLRRRGQQMLKTDRLRRFNWSLFSGWLLLKLLLLATLLLLPAWSAAKVAGQTAAHQAYLANRPGSGNTIRSADGLLAIALPHGWEQLNTIDPQPNRIAQMNVQGDLGILVWSQPKENLTVTTREQYSQVNIEVLSKGKDQFQILRHTTSLIPHPSVETELTWSDGPTRVVMLLHIRDTPQHFVQIRAWSTPTEFRNNTELLRKIIDSVQIETAR